jgi:hypothetical protein
MKLVYAKMSFFIVFKIIHEVLISRDSNTVCVQKSRTKNTHAY